MIVFTILINFLCTFSLNAQTETKRRPTFKELNSLTPPEDLQKLKLRVRRQKSLGISLGILGLVPMSFGVHLIHKSNNYDYPPCSWRRNPKGGTIITCPEGGPLGDVLTGIFLTTMGAALEIPAIALIGSSTSKSKKLKQLQLNVEGGDAHSKIGLGLTYRF